MKKQELLKRLIELGAIKTREGAGHEVWQSKGGAFITVPRHREAKEGTTKAILKQAEK